MFFVVYYATVATELPGCHFVTIQTTHKIRFVETNLYYFKHVIECVSVAVHIAAHKATAKTQKSCSETTKCNQSFIK